MTRHSKNMPFDSVLMDLKVTGKKQVFQALAVEASSQTGLSERFLFDALCDQEKRVSSAMGQGVAVAHLQLSSVTHSHVIFARLGFLVDFDSADQDPVDLVCLLISPDREGLQNLGQLSRLSRKLKDKMLCARLREAQSEDEIQLIMIESQKDKLAA